MFVTPVSKYVIVYVYGDIMTFYVYQSVEEFWKVQLALSVTLQILEPAIMITRSAVHGSSEPTLARLVKLPGTSVNLGPIIYGIKLWVLCFLVVSNLLFFPDSADYLPFLRH